MDDNMVPNHDVVLPRWFLWVVSGCSGLLILLCVPWASWVTTTLITINVKLDSVNDLNSRITVLEKLDAERRVITAVDNKRLSDLETKFKEFEFKVQIQATPRGSDK